MKKIIFGLLLGMLIAGTGQVIAEFDWRNYNELQDQERQIRKLKEIQRQNEEILQNQKKPC